MPRIVDNIDTYLRDLLLQTLERSTGLESSVGYFNLRGWASLKDAVDALPSSPDGPAVRLLVGMADSPGSELRRSLRIARSAPQMDNQMAARLRDEATREFREQLTWGVPSDAHEGALRALKQQIESGKVQVRLFLRHPLHAKLYLLHRDDPNNPRTGFVGSSNLTFSGLGGQGELNVDVLDHESPSDHHPIRATFGDRRRPTRRSPKLPTPSGRGGTMPKIGYARLTADGGIRTDGRGRKIGSVGAVLRTSRGHLIGSISENLGTVLHHNVCEYRAVIRGLQLAQEGQIRDLRVFLDSTLVVEQLSKKAKVRAPELKPYHHEAMKLVDSFGEGIRISWIPREWNSEADLLANLALTR